MRPFWWYFAFCALGVGLGAAALTSNHVHGAPNGATFAVFAWTIVAVFVLMHRGDVAHLGPLRLVNAELEYNGYHAEYALDDGFVLFYNPETDRMFQVRPIEDGAEVQRGHLTDPWEFEVDAAWRLRHSRIPDSLRLSMR